MNNKYYRFFYRNIYWFISALGLAVPFAVMYSIDLRVRRLERGVQLDIERIEKSGRKFSQIPRTF
jgi:hypothetical protein